MMPNDIRASFDAEELETVLLVEVDDALLATVFPIAPLEADCVVLTV